MVKILVLLSQRHFAVGGAQCGQRRTGGTRNPCRNFAEISYALLCTVMQFATDVTAKKRCKFNDLVPSESATNQGVVGSTPAGHAIFQRVTSDK
jgi:hypothetical protein